MIPLPHLESTLVRVKAKYVRRSLCECGFPVLKEDVPMGKIYLAYPDTIRNGQIICGSCHKTTACKLITLEGGILPLDILELDEGTVKEKSCTN